MNDAVAAAICWPFRSKTVIPDGPSYTVDDLLGWLSTTTNAPVEVIYTRFPYDQRSLASVLVEADPRRAFRSSTILESLERAVLEVSSTGESE